MLDLLLTLAVAASTILSTILMLLPSRYIRPSPPKATSESSGAVDEPKISVQVLVLGDIGRSPRMQYHAMSIAKHGGRVDIIGYKESTPHPGLLNNPLITILPLPPPPRILRSNALPFIVAGPLKVLWQIWSLFHALGYATKPARWLLVQNPPSIPTLFISAVICFLRNTHLIIDWHNYGWTILAGTRGATHPFVTISKYYEAVMGRSAPVASFTVTDAMAKQLRNKPYNVRSPILTLHDRPAAIFQPISGNEARRAFLKCLPETSAQAESIMTGKTRLLVSSTSWTPDEDFNLLLEALCSYSGSAKQQPPILAIITGKGPQKQMYLERIAFLKKESRLQNVSIATAWLSTEDYATLLACADLGVCLHMSSSGVDLPMKVVDMFGAGLPVVGYGNYASWGELVKEGVNGRGFVTSDDLATVLGELFGDVEQKQLAKLRKGAIEEGKRRWDDEWGGVAGRLLGLCE
ncbi:UDP-Glycosyltransferase phosphorylase [Venustampulla echinocandica]|uniref:Chitobiosyldiphosphodolichol beta-mannosyltransferase n=1 Tax=Venustampulla echinocandica TaxID=2656787 RepID=A0A370TJI9_9HELO|nr:UDP-Glycosyltransferase phosphorylase [Venustampulla echinocandica]RDL35683.1 UDP-Glycosyltransferase phosphorylase [Venustampulla echinocandica]